MHCLLTYHYSADYPQRRANSRTWPPGGAWPPKAGRVGAGGNNGNPPDKAVFMFDCADPSVIEVLVQADPYVQNGLVLPHHRAVGPRWWGMRRTPPGSSRMAINFIKNSYRLILKCFGKTP